MRKRKDIRFSANFVASFFTFIGKTDMVKQKHLGFFFLLFLIESMSAQTTTETFRKWSSGRLTWGDFVQRAAENGKTSDSYCFLSYNQERQKIHDTSVYRAVVFACVDTAESWVSPEAMTEENLRYHQLLFDLLELKARQLQVKVDSLSKIHRLDSIFQDAYREYAASVAQLDSLSDKGRNADVVSEWEYATAENLKLQPAEFLPDYVERKFGFGAHAGLGTGVFTSSLGTHFHPICGVAFGLDFAWGRSQFLFNGILEAVKAEREYYAPKCWSVSNDYEIFAFDITYGFAAVDRLRWRLSPFAGYGMAELSTANTNEGDDHLHMYTNRFVLGMSVDYKLKNFLNLGLRNMKSREHQELSLRARLFASYLDFYEDLNGFMFNISLEINVFDRFIKLK